VHMESAPVLRVLLGDLAPIMAIGLRSVLEEEGIDVIGQETERSRIVPRAQRLQPDVVVLDFDHDGAEALASEIRQVAPRSKVILWTRDETVMGVLESVSDTPRLVDITTHVGLRSELSSGRHPDGLEE
jgi:AmiR/NasT family two-component response regulator